jgi:hypothetical protein
VEAEAVAVVAVGGHHGAAEAAAVESVIIVGDLHGVHLEAH